MKHQILSIWKSQFHFFSLKKKQKQRKNSGFLSTNWYLKDQTPEKLNEYLLTNTTTTNVVEFPLRCILHSFIFHVFVGGFGQQQVHVPPPYLWMRSINYRKHSSYFSAWNQAWPEIFITEGFFSADIKAFYSSRCPLKNILIRIYVHQLTGEEPSRRRHE